MSLSPDHGCDNRLKAGGCSKGFVVLLSRFYIFCRLELLVQHSNGSQELLPGWHAVPTVTGRA
jgi:hypothetical protein